MTLSTRKTKQIASSQNSDFEEDQHLETHAYISPSRADESLHQVNLGFTEQFEKLNNISSVHIV